MTRIEAREHAMHHVNNLQAQGYTVADAKAEIARGAGGPGMHGYEIRKGKITCPAFSEHTFDFGELAQAIQDDQQQPTLFEL